MSWPLVHVLLGGAASALFYLAATLGTPGALIFAYLTQLPLFAVGLSQGAMNAAVAGAIAAALLILAESGLFSVVFILLNAAPVWWLCRLALQEGTAPDGSRIWYPPGLLVVWLTGLAVMVMTAAYLYFGVADGGLPGAIERFLRFGLGQMVTAPEAQIDSVVRMVAPIFPGVLLMSWMLMTVVNGALAQGVLVRFSRNLRPTPRIADIDLPRWALIPMAIGLALAVVIGGPLGHYGTNLSLVLCLPFFFLGLAVVHAFARRRALRWPILVGIYALVIVFGWPAAVLVILGFVEQWAGIRQRLGGAPPPADRES